MAKRNKKGKNRKSGAKSTGRRGETAVLTTQRKREILGLTLMALAVLIAVAIASFSAADRSLVDAVGIAGAFRPDVPAADNLLGILGAHLAYYAVPMFLGYPALGFALFLFIWGYVAVRGRVPDRLPFLTGLAIVALFVISTTIGWCGQVFSVDVGLWSGYVGQGLNSGLSRAMGTVGTGILLVLFIAVIFVLGIDRDVQHSVERVERWFGNASAFLARRRGKWGIKRAENREKKAQRKEKRVEAKRRQVRDDIEPSQPDAVSQERTSQGEEVPVPEPVSSDRSDASIVNDLFRTPGPGSVSGIRTGDEEVDEAEESTGTQQGAWAPSDELPSTLPDREDVAFSVHRPAEEKHANIDRLKRTAHTRSYTYRFPSVDLLEHHEAVQNKVDIADLEEKKQIVLDKLDDHKIELRDIEAIVGPTVTLFELKPKRGVKISQIKSLENDLAMALAAKGIRMIAPIPGKSAVGLEIPNRHRELVRIKSVLTTERFRDTKMELPVILGKTIQNEVYIADLTKMPHLLIAGATGSGKSVGLNCLIITLLYACHPADLKFVMIDPKKIELQQYANIRNHYLAMPEDAEEPITTDFAHALGLLKSCIKEMENRYDLLSTAGVRSIKEYNERFKKGRIKNDGEHQHLPHLVIIIDELADLMMTAGKEIEAPIARLAQMARAVGLHLVVATQRPSVNVITGLIKANFPSRIAYQVATGIDSRTIMDQYGAERLVGNGDMLFMKGSQVLRLQSPYISLDEVESVTQHVGSQDGPGPYLLPGAEDATSGSADSAPGTSDADVDELFEEAAHIIVRNQQGSVSLLQRKLSVGYTRAARIVDQLEDAGIVGPFEGSKARQVLIPDELELETYLENRSRS